jgi:hypothetical protein
MGDIFGLPDRPPSGPENAPIDADSPLRAQAGGNAMDLMGNLQLAAAPMRPTMLEPF